jgi:anaerobic magnesium-protoporphyrin IX monomethyl ester cyclase
MHKGISPELTMRVLGWVREVGLKPVPNVILGFPGETKKSAWKTIKFVEKISPDYVGFYNVATPFPGTPMYDSIKENGWLRVTDFDKYDTTTPIFETPWLSMKELGKLREAAFHHFYLRTGYFLHNFRKRKFWSLSTALTILSHLKESIKLKLR